VYLHVDVERGARGETTGEGSSVLLHRPYGALRSIVPMYRSTGEGENLEGDIDGSLWGPIVQSRSTREIDTEMPNVPRF
jgi:hypothetical protein